MMWHSPFSKTEFAYFRPGAFTFCGAARARSFKRQEAREKRTGGPKNRRWEARQGERRKPSLVEVSLRQFLSDRFTCNATLGGALPGRTRAEGRKFHPLLGRSGGRMKEGERGSRQI